MNQDSSIAFVTSLKLPGFATDDLLLVDALKQHRCQCVAMAWDDPAADWKTFDMILLRSPWNYHLLPREFSSWISSVPPELLVNSAELVLWNMDKRYLRHLREAGTLVPSTVWLDEIDDSIPHKGFDFGRSEYVIVKPSISASSFQTRKINKHDLQDVIADSRKHAPEGGMMIQEYIEEVIEGEVSLIYFGMRFSHAVLKKPKSGDFRVQSEFGGTAKVMEVSQALIEEGRRILSLLPFPPHYARIDGVEREGKFVLMEAELIEPVLFFGLSPGSAATFARVIVDVLKQKRTITI